MAYKFKYIAFILIMVLLSLPALQGLLHIYEGKPLEGDFVPSPKPELTLHSWFEMEFQTAYEPYLEENIGFHNELVRLQNQLDYSLFKRPNAEGAVIGKDGHLFEADYIRAYLGKDFVGYNIIERKSRRIRFLQQYLKNEFDIDLVIIMEPGKASVYPEFIPDRFHPDDRTISNYQGYLTKFDEFGVNYIDLNQYFIDIKDTLSYPAFTKNGIHWSIYAMTIAADTMLRYIEGIRGIDMPEAYINDWLLTNQPQRTDNDVSKTLNLIWEPSMDTTAYPRYAFEEDDSRDKPMVLVVGDSFYWNFFNTLIPRHLFKNEAFWYFYKQVFPDTYVKPLTVAELDIQAEIEKQDVVILTVTERFLYNFDWGFIDDLYVVYAPDSPWEPLYKIKNGIAKHGPWFNEVIRKARIKNIPLGEMIDADARYTFEMQDPYAYFSLVGPQHYVDAIRNDPEWFSAISRDALEAEVSQEQKLQENAEFYMQQQHPAAFNEYSAIQTIMGRIRNDSTWLGHVRQKADFFYIPLEEMTLIDADYIYKLEKPDK